MVYQTYNVSGEFSRCFSPGEREVWIPFSGTLGFDELKGFFDELEGFRGRLTDEDGSSVIQGLASMDGLKHLILNKRYGDGNSGTVRYCFRRVDDTERQLEGTYEGAWRLSREVDVSGGLTQGHIRLDVEDLEDHRRTDRTFQWNPSRMRITRA